MTALMGWLAVLARPAEGLAAHLAPDSSSGLYPTKTRLALLRQVAAGEVSRYRDEQDYVGTGGQRVTARMAELERAHWVQLVELPHTLAPEETYRQWRMTPVGRAVLAGAQ